jgi:ATP-binding cassette subfamily B protein
MDRYKRLLPYVFRQWRFLIAIFVLTIISSAMAALQPWPMKLLVDYALGDSGAPARLANLLSVLELEPTSKTLVILAALCSLCIFAVTSVLSVALSLSWTIGGQRMVFDLAADLYDRLQRLSLLFHHRRSIGDTLSRLTGDAWSVTTLSSVMMSPVQQACTLVAIGAVAFSLDAPLAMLSFAVAPFLAASSLFFGRRMKKKSRESREAESRLMSFVHQTLGAIPVVQAFGAEPRNGKRFQDLSEDCVAVSQRGALVSSSYGLVNGLIITAGTAIILYIGGLRVLSGAMTLGTLLVFLSYVRTLQGVSRGFFQTFIKLKSAEAKMDRVLEILESEDDVPEHPSARPIPSGGSDRGHVSFEAVTFGYEQDRPVLTDITFEALPGETIALVGPTGSGKTTLASLIPRFFDPWEGTVTLEGVDVRELQLCSLRDQVALVLQEPFLLPTTIAENIAYGQPEVSREEIVAAAEAARADEFIRRLPEGYETTLGERAADLSGGERQRLSIARALLKDARVLILDEPTSALDVGTEELLLEALERLMEGRTTFIIAHRMSTIRRADRIVFLRDGKIEETGTREELLSADGAFKQLYSLQFPAAGQEVAS